ncbi:hypothetical protein WA026_020881 [Henosepilachna vigintioctopunctata]|uniref:Uncharacterized protein n=1 Tax=Henosepilachna vigintioctopunctata TaxID=420089 RepID=A0AAW1UFI9_9CUCU
MWRSAGGVTVNQHARPVHFVALNKTTAASAGESNNHHGRCGQKYGGEVHRYHWGEMPCLDTTSPAPPATELRQIESASVARLRSPVVDDDADVGLPGVCCYLIRRDLPKDRKSCWS